MALRMIYVAFLKPGAGRTLPFTSFETAQTFSSPLRSILYTLHEAVRIFRSFRATYIKVYKHSTDATSNEYLEYESEA